MKTSSGLMLLAACALCVAASAVSAQDAGIVVTPSELQWRPSPRVPGLQGADVIGDSTKPGPYTQRVRFPANFMVHAHTHPENRQYTIISGTWYVGWGDKFDESKLKALPAGSFYTEPANVPHFVATKEPVEVQISGNGPTAVMFVNPAHAPKKP
jgi:uncharacterized RmlC-like cupin family protein